MAKEALVQGLAMAMALAQGLVVMEATAQATLHKSGQ